jgi:predicted ATPase
MATTSTSWNLVVSKETDESVRQFLASQDGGQNGDLSLFVEDAVRKQIFEATLRAVREKNAKADPAFLDQAIDEALAWARQR